LRKGQMTNYFNRKRDKAQKQSNIRLIIIFIVLFLISYFLFFY